MTPLAGHHLFEIRENMQRKLKMLKEISGFQIEVTRKKIKRMYLSIKPGGQINISAPYRMPNAEIENFVNEHTEWINKNQKKMSAIKNIAPKYQDGDHIYLFGEKYILHVNEGSKNSVTSSEKNVFLTVKSLADTNREEILNEWYREKLKEKIAVLLPECEKITGLYCNDWRIKNMKTRWGTCNITAKRIWINLRLAKMSEIYLKYVIFHELTHLAISNHGSDFKALLSSFMPNWREVRKSLNEEAVVK